MFQKCYTPRTTQLAISKDKKKEIYNTVADAVKDSESLVFVSFKGLSVGDAGEMRRAFRDADVKYTVLKKKIAKKAMDEAKIEGTMPEIEGEFALAYGKDLIAPAREVFEFQKKFDTKISIVGGIFDGRYMSQSEMQEIAAIPPMKTLHAQVVNLINSPLQGLVMALSEIAKKQEGATA